MVRAGLVAATAVTAWYVGPFAPVPAGQVAATCSVPAQVATWPLRRQAMQVLAVPVEETDVGAVTRQVAHGAGAVLLFGSRAPDGLGTDLQRLLAHAHGGVVPAVMTDEEGGAIQRMPDLVGDLPSARTMGATLTPRQIRRLARRVGGRMLAAGVTADLAPVLDLDDGPGPDAQHPIGTRSFSIHARRATADGLAFAHGLLSAGVLPVVKHFPGLGGTSPNTDVAPAATKPWRTLQRHGLRPFEAAVTAGLPAVMVSNARVPGLTRLPAGLSRRVVHDVLRGRLGFRGLVVTDSLSAGAISGAGYTVPRAAVRAVRVGADLVLFTADPPDVAGATRAVARALVRAVRHHHLPRRRLRDAAVHMVLAKDSPVCPDLATGGQPAAEAAVRQ